MVVDAGDPDPPPSEVPVRATETLMESAAGRARLARETLEFAGELAG
jgi:hypothetical protein